MDTLFDQSDVADLDDKELEPVADEAWEEAAAAAEQAEPVLDAAALRRAGEEDRDDDEDDEQDAEAAAAAGAECEGECEADCEGDDEAASDCACAADHACRGNEVRPGSCCLLNAPEVEPAAVMDEAAAAAAAREQLVAMAAAAVAPAAQEQLAELAAPAALAGEFAPVAVSAAADLVEGGQELSVGL